MPSEFWNMTFKECNILLKGYMERQRIDFANKALLNDGLARQIASFVVPKNPNKIVIPTSKELYPNIFIDNTEKPKITEEEIVKKSTLVWRSWLGI